MCVCVRVCVRAVWCGGGGGGVCVCVCRCRQGSVLLCHRDEPAVPAARRVHTGPGRDGNLLRVPV